MKRGKVLMTVLVVLAVLFASCSNGMSKDDAEGAVSTKAIKVSLSLGGEAANIAQKAVEMSGGANKSTYTYYYRATPNWTADAKGKTTSNDNNFVPINYDNDNHDYEDEYALGYFTPGNWTFDVEVRAANTTTVLYVGSNDNVQISPTSARVEVPMRIKTAQATAGTVNIAIAVPDVGAGTGVKLYVDGVLDDDPAFTKYSTNDLQTGDPIYDYTVTSNTDATPTGSTGWRLFNKTVTPTPGTHTFILNYMDGNTRIGGAAIAFTVMSEETYLICGTIVDGEYQVAAITLTGMEIKLEPAMTTTPQQATAVDMDGSLTCHLPEGFATYTWSVNGKVDLNSTGKDFTLDTFEAGVYEITCMVTKGNAIGSVSKTITVVPPNKFININAKIDEDGDGDTDTGNINEADTGSIIICTAVNVPQDATSVKWYVRKDDEAFGDPTSGNTFTFTPSEAGIYKVVCKASKNSGLIACGERTITIVEP